MNKYSKALGLVAVIVATFVASILTDGITPAEWSLVAAEAFAAVGVHIVPNLATGVAGYAKTVVTFLVTGSTALALVVDQGVTGAELLEVLIAAAASIGLVAGLRNHGDYRAKQLALAKANTAIAWNEETG